MKIVQNVTLGITRAETELAREVRLHPANAVIDQCQALEPLYRFVEGNYTVLQFALQQYCSNGSWLLHTNQKQHIETLLRDQVELCLFNFLSAAKSLAEHTTRLHEKLYRDSMPEYGSRKKELIRDGLVVFLHNLRDYATHSRTLHPRPMRTFSAQKMEVAINLSKERLLNSDYFKAPAKAYLATQPEEINVATVVTDYYERILAFHTWFKEEQRRIHQAEFSALEELGTKMRAESARLAEGVLAEMSKSEEAYPCCHFEAHLSSVTPSEFWARVDKRTPEIGRLQAIYDELEALGCSQEVLKAHWSTISEKIEFAEAALKRSLTQNRAPSNLQERILKWGLIGTYFKWKARRDTTN